MRRVVHYQASALAPDSTRYRRHPEQTLLCQLVEQYYPVFAERLRREGRCLPLFVEREFEDYLKCGRRMRSSTYWVRRAFRVTPTSTADAAP